MKWDGVKGGGPEGTSSLFTSASDHLITNEATNSWHYTTHPFIMIELDLSENKNKCLEDPH
jgi:hypothetical protein